MAQTRVCTHICTRCKCITAREKLSSPSRLPCTSPRVFLCIIKTVRALITPPRLRRVKPGFRAREAKYKFAQTERARFVRVGGRWEEYRTCARRGERCDRDNELPCVGRETERSRCTARWSRHVKCGGSSVSRSGDGYALWSHRTRALFTISTYRPTSCLRCERQRRCAYRCTVYEPGILRSVENFWTFFFERAWRNEDEKFMRFARLVNKLSRVETRVDTREGQDS